MYEWKGSAGHGSARRCGLANGDAVITAGGSIDIISTEDGQPDSSHHLGFLRPGKHDLI